MRLGSFSLLTALRAHYHVLKLIANETYTYDKKTFDARAIASLSWKERNGICYDKDGVKVRHWPRSHVKDGASAYHLDWEDAGLSLEPQISNFDVQTRA